MQGGRPYKPNPRTVLVIGAGAPWVWEAPPLLGCAAPEAQFCGDFLARAGFDVESVYSREYDRYPRGWKQRTPDMKRPAKTHASFADEIVVPLLAEMVREGRGPVAIIAGSRGGQLTLPRLWQLGWRGGAICANAGCTTTAELLGWQVPSSCRLALVTGGCDFFEQSADPQQAAAMPRRDQTMPMLLYHDPQMGHTGHPDDYVRHGHHFLTEQALLELLRMVSQDGRTWRRMEKEVQVDGCMLPGGAWLKAL